MVYSDYSGRHRTLEYQYPCQLATETHLCSNVSYEDASIIERQPERARQRSKDEELFITEGRDGHRRVYRDVTGRSRRRTSKLNHSSRRNDGEQASANPSSSASSPSAYSFPTARPAVPSPTTNSAAFPFFERERRPHSGTNESGRSFSAMRTSVNEHGPSPDMSGAAAEMHRPPLAVPERSRQPYGSGSTTAVENSPVIEPVKRKPSIKVRTDTASPAASSPTISSPGLSQLPKLRHSRNDSAKDMPSVHPPSPPSNGRQRVGNERQVRFEPGREAFEDDALRQARHNAARETSRERRERHRREASDALEGKRKAESRKKRLEEERNQMARERAVADARRHEQQHRDSREVPIATAPRTASGEHSRSPYGTVPPYARSPQSPGYVPRDGQRVKIHQSGYPGRPLEGDSIAAHGEGVIAHEQVRFSGEGREGLAQWAPRRPGDALGEMAFEDPYGEDAAEYSAEVYINDSRRAYECRRAARDQRRAMEGRESWRDGRYV